ncbi:hypothetical protein GCM10008956_37760 [Deinococcus arenae]|uniref:Uncharacterized protein n=1 Tax=Deinococcus arenae TaxID=1452751 RepID=A0A8H9GX88_9DEIO|nr:hypothetical protein [Deinococcus arenae]AWT34683.1 hypothetical protein DM785_03265 [Deinococcus actinosclerus]GGM58625.1 hypothetical protein GCM10008956_37760 [Deinococcus arenae]
MTGPKKGSRGRAPKRNTAQGRGGATRETTRPARERSEGSGAGRDSRGGESRPVRTELSGTGGPRRSAAKTGGAPSGGAKSGGGRSGAVNSGARGGTNPARRKPGEAAPARGEGRSEGRTESRAGSRPGSGPRRAAPPKVKKALPELKRVQLDAPAPDTVFTDRDGEKMTFPDSNLKRVAAKILTEKNKAWRYRPFSFPLFTDRGGEQTFHFDFYIYDYEDSVIRLILVVPFESREVWDRVGRFKRQYPMYTYELWTPEKLYRLSGPRGRLEF